MHGLRHAAGFVQSKLAYRLQTRFTPVIQFVLDQGVKKSIEMTRLINEALGRGPVPADGTAEEQVECEESAGGDRESGVRSQDSERGNPEDNPCSPHSDP